MDDKVVIGGLIWIIVGMYFKERGETPLRLRIVTGIWCLLIICIRIYDLKEKNKKKKDKKPD